MLHLTKKAVKLWQCAMDYYQHKYCLGGYLKVVDQLVKKIQIYQYQLEDVVYGILLTFPEFQAQKVPINGEIQQTVNLISVKPWSYPEQKAAF